MWNWWKSRKRRTLDQQPLTAAEREGLERHGSFMTHWSPAARDRLLHRARWFVAEKFWEGCQGLVLTDAMKFAIALHANRLSIAFPDEDDVFSRVQTILVYPAAYTAPQKTQLGQIVVEDTVGRLGESWSHGPIVLSWSDAEAATTGHSPGRNVVVHEFAHVLDGLNGTMDGVPPIEDPAEAERWLTVFNEEFHRLQHAMRLQRPTVIDYYGATNLIEFFAVATESYFEATELLATYHPELYNLLQNYYRYDPQNTPSL